MFLKWTVDNILRQLRVHVKKRRNSLIYLDFRCCSIGVRLKEYSSEMADLELLGRNHGQKQVRSNKRVRSPCCWYGLGLGLGPAGPDKLLS